MSRRFSQFCSYLLFLSIILLQTREIRCLRRLTRSKLSSDADDIRSLLSSALDSNPSRIIATNDKRDATIEDAASARRLDADNVAFESNDDAIYDDEIDEDDSDQQRDLESLDYKRSVDADASADDAYAEKSLDDVDSDSEEDADLRRVKDVAKREAKNEDDYDEDQNADSSISSDGKIDDVETRSASARITKDVEKNDNRREASVGDVNSDLNFERQIEDQIQRRIDSIKDDIKREIERKQQVREIEANNAKYDELAFDREEDEAEGDEIEDDGTSISSKRSIPSDPEATDGADKSGQSSRTKRSDVDTDNNEVVDETAPISSKRSISSDSKATDEADESGKSSRSKRSDVDTDNNKVVDKRSSIPSKRSISSHPDATSQTEQLARDSASRSKRSDLRKVVENEENKASGLVLPVKKRNVERRVTLVERRDLRGNKRKDRSSILIPERGHAEVKDELPADLTLGSNLRLARSDTVVDAVPGGASRSTRSVVGRGNEVKRCRRNMANEAKDNDVETQEGNFLFPARERPDCRTRRRRSRGRKKKARQRPRHSRGHRAIRESSENEEEATEERNKRAMSMDEDAALEYKESFGGFQSDANGALGRFKRIRRSPKIS